MSSNLRYSVLISGKCLSMTIIMLLLFNVSYAQDQAYADSLETEYETKNLRYAEKLELLKELAINFIETDKKLKYSNELIKTAKERDCTKYIFTGMLQAGNSHLAIGNFSKALSKFYNAAEIADSEKDQGIINVTIGDVYSLTNNHDRAAAYYNEAITIFRNINNSNLLAYALFNAGDGYLKSQQLDKALNFIDEAEQIFRELGNQTNVAYCIGTKGLIYAEQGKTEQAENNFKLAIETLEQEEDYAPICEFLNTMSDIYFKKGQDDLALEYALLSLDLAKAYNFKNESIEASLRLSQIYEKKGNIPESYRAYKEYIAYKDSVLNVETAQNIAGMRADYEVSQKQAEVDLLNEQRKNQQLLVLSIAVATFLIGLLAFGLYRRNRFIKRTSKIIEKERNRSERLLLNILPEETARELKKNGRVKAKKFASVTVLFADFKRFTLVAEKLPPERLIKTIDYYFSHFDKIMDKYGIEKIKTIGDSYMAASGLPFPSHDHAVRILLAAFEMTQFVKDTKDNSLFDDADFEVRIGLNSGPVVAGVVGTKKFAYDIWGDTVNIAARMEAHSDIGRINISENTYELVKDVFECEYRGEIEVKNNRILKMYYVNGVKENIEKKAV